MHQLFSVNYKFITNEKQFGEINLFDGFIPDGNNFFLG